MSWSKSPKAPSVDPAWSTLKRVNPSDRLVEHPDMEPDTPTPAAPPRLLSEQDALAVRQTSRFRVALDRVIRGALKSFVDSHGPTLEKGLLHSASKRSASAVWALMAHHPDVRVVVGKFHDEQAKQLAACEAECEKRSAMIRDLRAQLAQAVREREALKADADDALELLRKHEAWLGEEHARAEAAEAEAATLRAALKSAEAWIMAVPIVDTTQDFRVLDIREQLLDELRAALRDTGGTP